ncbi:RNA-binding protein [Nostoc sp. 'Peltigera membranacea cyanobiont' 210A]|uniref:RNA-binding S4 domain-containing protein n=1 Tax=Nostoc sp. 'Peltigera membranacea cyanobiont' 210A TaxID=2014529 RepID=UPI000B952040|nr:RNA-binding S4 domain-containing protein [Nostoc sp. 'Peltigera membranacea cyanobiont' 210A]OYD97706.1 RNA-binding protein [Nostoc sp. 'Peltigera membranacea cyanobiont' 210A]
MKKVRDNTIKLNQFLKLMGIVPTGGQAKLMIQGGDVQVNGMLETRRGRRLVPGDKVTIQGQTLEVNLNNNEDPDVMIDLAEQTE